MRTTLGPLAALAMLAVLSVSCSTVLTGGGSGTNTAIAVADSGGSTRDQAVKFAACMRANGVSEFPDPDASGTLTIDGIANGSSLDTHSVAFKQAIAACQDLQPPGFTGQKRNAQEQANALKFAQCIRDNGVKDFPDPTPDGPLVDTSRMPGNPAGRNIPGLQAAMQTCRDFAANAGVVGAQ